MTKVAGIPEQLRSLAATLVASSPELELAATMLGSTLLPEMPPGVSAQVQAQIDQARAAVRRAAAAGRLEGDDLKRRGLWLEIAGQVEALWKPSSTAFAMVNTPLDAIEGIERWRVARLMQAWGKYSQDVLAVAGSEGEDSLPALNAMLRFQEAHPELSPSRFSGLVEGAGSAEGYEEMLGPLATFAEGAGKFLPPVAIVAGLVQFVIPEHKHGAYMVADRSASAAIVLGSGASMAIEMSLISLGPLGVGVMTVVLVAAGVWELYENRVEVAKLTVAGGEFVAHHAYVLAGPPGIAAKVLWDDRRPLARAAVSAYETTKGIAEGGAKIVVGGVKDDLAEGKSLVSDGKSLLGYIGI